MRSGSIRRSILAVLVFAAIAAQAQQATLFLVRHADKVSAADDALLSAHGKQRAECLAKTLKEANISAIYATDVIRTQQTAEPTAKESGAKITTLPKSDTATLVKDLNAADGNVLVVGHADTLGPVVSQLGAGKIAPFADGEYDRLTIIEMLDRKAGTPITLRYCAEF